MDSKGVKTQGIGCEVEIENSVLREKQYADAAYTFEKVVEDFIFPNTESIEVKNGKPYRATLYPLLL